MIMKTHQSWTHVFATLIATTLVQTALLLNGNTKSISEAAKITSLPGQPKVQFKQYSGYITVGDTPKRSLFYYFVEAETNPASKPLVLWLNGGPGCSSIGAGAFCEHGPFKPSRNILLKNDYSWNKVANMLYLETPAGVGFSYSDNQTFYTQLNDDKTAHDNLIFLERWFREFPGYKSRDFFITGESYAGHYVPQLAKLIVQSKVKFNLKGIALGNPLLEFNTDFNSRAEYLWSHGLISDSTYESFTHVCNFSQIRRQYGDSGVLSPVCSRVWREVSRELSRYLDTYDVTLDVCLSPVFAQSEILNKLQETSKIDVCVEDQTTTYLNRRDVQKAFNAKLIGVTAWTICSEVVKYDMKNLEIPTVPLLGALVKSGVRVLVYSGDQDSVVPLIGSRILVNGLAKELGLNTTVPYRAWFEDRQACTSGGRTVIDPKIATPELGRVTESGCRFSTGEGRADGGRVVGEIGRVTVGCAGLGQ